MQENKHSLHLSVIRFSRGDEKGMGKDTAAPTQWHRASSCLLTRVIAFRGSPESDLPNFVVRTAFTSQRCDSPDRVPRLPRSRTSQAQVGKGKSFHRLALQCTSLYRLELKHLSQLREACLDSHRTRSRLEILQCTVGGSEREEI